MLRLKREKMPDITKCTPTLLCPLKDKCFRYTSEPAPILQQYDDFSFFVRWSGKRQTCETFMPQRKKGIPVGGVDY